MDIRPGLSQATAASPGYSPAGNPAKHGATLPPGRRLLVFAIVAFTLLMMSIDSTIVATALHSMQQGLDTTANWVAWTLTAYSFGFVLMLPVSGKLAERFGRRRVFLGSVAVFTVASLFCGLADNIYLLIALRAVQAAGGAGFTPSATGIIVDHFGDSRDRAVGLFGSIFPLGAMIGPIFGGLFVTWWNWRGIFFVNVPIGLVVFALTLRYVPKDAPRPAGARRQIGFPGLLLLGGGLLGLMLAASYLGERGARPWSAPFLLSLGLSLLFLWGFIRHSSRAARPFIAPRLIWGRDFGSVNLVNLLFGGVTLGLVALIPLYATSRYGIGALQSGTLLVAEGLAAAATSTLLTFLLRRTGYRRPIGFGMIVVILGLLLLAIRPPDGVSPGLWLAVAAFLVGAGFGATNPAARNAGLQLAPGNASTLAALRSMCMQIGTIAAISIATALFAASGEQGTAFAFIYAGSALLLLLALPLVRLVPEHRGAW